MLEKCLTKMSENWRHEEKKQPLWELSEPKIHGTCIKHCSLVMGVSNNVVGTEFWGLVQQKK